MAFSPFRRLRLEALETRYAPTSLLDTTVPPPTSGTYLIDPTLSPSDPNATTVSALIVAIGGPTTGGGYNITVTGLSASNLQPGASLQVGIGNALYSVTSYSVGQGGQVTLTLVNTPGLAEALSTATTVSVIIGSGNNTTPPSTTPPTVIDPTLAPSGG